MAVDRVLVDTNVLLSAVDDSRIGHLQAVRLLERDPRRLYVTPQVIREFLSVATRATGLNGLGLSGLEAARNVRELRRSVEALDEPAEGLDRLTVFVGGSRVLGKQVHDAWLVAVAVEHQLSAIITANVKHFQRFDDLIDIEPLVPEG